MSNVQQTNDKHVPQVAEAKLHDGKSIEIEIHGQGPTLLLPVNPHPVEGTLAEQMREYGADPALGLNLINGLRDVFRVVAFDYEGHVLQNPKPQTLTPDNIAADILAIADTVQAERFAYYGYSWLAVNGLQLALRTNRLSALVMGGFPPLDGPYTEMLGVTAATYELAAAPQTLEASDDDEWGAMTMSKDQTQQFLTLYQALRGFDDRAAQAHLSCPRLCFVGSADKIQYGAKWNNIFVNIAGPVLRGQAELEHFGWDVRMLEGLDHIQAMQASHVVPILRPWLISKLISPSLA